MNRYRKLILAVGLGVSIPLILMLAWSHHASAPYREAEPLLEIVTPLAAQLEQFKKEKGRLPRDLSEIEGYSPGHHFAALSKYEYKLRESEDRIFEIRVNQKYGFYISKDFQPNWVFDYPTRSVEK